MQLVATVLTVTTLALISLTAFNLDARQEADPSRIKWEQPASIDHIFTEPISASTWQFDFDTPEQLLASLRFTPGNTIVLDEATVILMKRLHNWQLGHDLQPADQARMQFLISKFFPDTTCYHSFYDLWGRYVAFMEAEQEQTDPSHLQAQFFSTEEIDGLFGRQNRLNLYLSARSQILNNTHLSDDQRKQALTDLNPGSRRDKTTPAKVTKNGSCQ